jgi:tRNA-2-methylthio-N6-dimethylallyladenosine synthase
VIQGCDHRCTFCIVPQVRGREVHRSLAAVVEECRRAVAEGAREVVLLGQNVDDYRDPAGAGGLAALVRAVVAIEGLSRVRFLTSHPQDLEVELLEVMAANHKVAHELQLPVQSGDDGILKRMARGYQVRHYRALIERARGLMPDLGLYTDVIVGFPGETEEAFLNTRRLLEELQFDVVHLAQYSPRPGTFAAQRWPDDVPAEEKRRRINDLLDLQRRIAGGRARRWLGGTVEVLVEGQDGLGRPYGRNREGKRVVVKGARLAPGSMVAAVVEEATPGQLAARLA